MKIKFVNSGDDSGVGGVVERVASWVGSVGLAVSDGTEGVADWVGFEGGCVGEGAEGVVLIVGVGSTVPALPGVGVL